MEAMSIKPVNPKMSLDYSYFINGLSSRRRPGITRELTKKLYNAPKETISLAEGMPNDGSFPFEAINVVLKDGSTFTLQGGELAASLQYLPSQGYPPLLKTLKEFTYFVHEPPNWQGTDVIITNGSQCGISKSIEMCIEEGVPILVQNPLYTGTEIVMKPYRPQLLPIEQDEFGVIPEHLVATLEDWKCQCSTDPTKKMPKIFYINPTAANPTGVTIPLDRKKEIYRICCDYNILILEDDAYYFMDFQDAKPVSFLSLDVEGRVLRFDSLSKVLASGLRLGWVTGPKQLITNIELHIQSAYLHSSSLSQSMVNNIFRQWGFEKMLQHFATVSNFYRVRRDIIIAAMEKHLKGLCDWSIPSGGMFVWIKVRNVPDVYEMLMTRGLKKHVCFAPGQAFMADPTVACNYIRAAYSRASPKQIDKAMRLLAELIREEQALLRRKLDNFI
ncbi:kynurenine/alpha-aminoadipate aminotransferase, mitochondrial [Coccinella septempunctata]|uniref:kynurenine/alpha-aminoadipate aminotransferase, mitochondrial n=1 Tax=Coccinella septempunctata TaxID=41139 RepID=UPI001D080E20|nr:kynurenine/alpha-aminoadipate aminotransferase, mitochondrial [Coccinella septempunctata]